MSDKPQQERLTREEQAKREIGQTEISRGLAWFMTVAFLLTISVPPTCQLIHELRDRTATDQTVPVLSLFSKLPGVADRLVQTPGGAWNRIIAANDRLSREISDYESDLEERSLFSRQLLGPTQHYLTQNLRLGNENAYVGVGNWLFYRPDVDYLTGPGFLDPAVLRHRAAERTVNGVPVDPDPRPAILDFHRQLAQRGIQLILMPVPGKPAIHPELLTKRYGRGMPRFENVSFRRFRQEMESAGVLVFDPGFLLSNRAKTANQSHVYEAQQFLATDSHWTTYALEFVVEQLKGFIHENCPLPTRAAMNYGEQSLTVHSLGDIALMLRLPSFQKLYGLEQAVPREVTLSNGRPWQSDPAADILLLGDSFTNIYSLPEMKWGTGAGLAERLSFVLQRPVDRIAQNNGGATAVRQELARQMAQGGDRLQGKRVVIWEFATRELAFGDWKRIPLPDVPHTEKPPRNQLATLPGKGQLIRGKVRANAGSPVPNTVPYREAVSTIHLDGVDGISTKFKDTEIVVLVWGMRDGKLTQAMKFAPGQLVSFRLVPWNDVRQKYERFNRIELEDPEFRLVELPIYWAEEVP